MAPHDHDDHHDHDHQDAPAEAALRVKALETILAKRGYIDQAEIDKILPGKTEYVVTTSDYANMRERMLKMENNRKPDDPNKPQLRKAPGVDGTDKQDDDSRPTLKRRDLTQ